MTTSEDFSSGKPTIGGNELTKSMETQQNLKNIKKCLAMVSFQHELCGISEYNLIFSSQILFMKPTGFDEQWGFKMGLWAGFNDGQKILLFLPKKMYLFFRRKMVYPCFPSSPRTFFCPETH